MTKLQGVYRKQTVRRKKIPLINNCFKVNRLTSQSKTQTGRIDLKKPSRKLPGSPVVRILHFHC